MFDLSDLSRVLVLVMLSGSISFTRMNAVGAARYCVSGLIVEIEQKGFQLSFLSAHSTIYFIFSVCPYLSCFDAIQVSKNVVCSKKRSLGSQSGFSYHFQLASCLGYRPFPRSLQTIFAESFTVTVHST